MCVTHSEQRWAHVGLHEVVVEAHDLNQVLQGCHLHRDVGHLSSLTHHLHDDVSLTLQV